MHEIRYWKLIPTYWVLSLNLHSALVLAYKCSVKEKLKVRWQPSVAPIWNANTPKIDNFDPKAKNRYSQVHTLAIRTQLGHDSRWWPITTLNRLKSWPSLVWIASVNRAYISLFRIDKLVVLSLGVVVRLSNIIPGQSEMRVIGRNKKKPTIFSKITEKNNFFGGGGRWPFSGNGCQTTKMNKPFL